MKEEEIEQHELRIVGDLSFIYTKQNSDDLEELDRKQEINVADLLSSPMFKEGMSNLKKILGNADGLRKKDEKRKEETKETENTKEDSFF